MSELPTIFESPTTGAPRLVGEEYGDSHTALNTTLVGVEFLPYKTDEASVVTDFTDADDSDTMSCARSDISNSDMEENGRDSVSFSSGLFRRSDLKVSSESATLLINEQSKFKEANGETVYKFGFGQSPFLPPDFVMEEFAERVHHKEYSEVAGLPLLREKVALFHNHYDKLDIDPKNVIVGSGSKILIYAILSSFRMANVFIITPSWVSYEPQADLAKLNTVRVDTCYEEGWRLTPKRLHEALSAYSSTADPSICIFNYPGNPDGLSYTSKELKALAKVFRDNNVLVVSDEIYGLLDHAGKHTSIAQFYPEGTIVCTGLSKWCGAGGWRLGVSLFPSTFENTLKPVVVGILSETISCVASPVQYAAVKAYTLCPEVDLYLHHQRRILSTAGRMFYERLTAAGVQMHLPTAGFYCYLDFSPLAQVLAEKRGITTSYDLCQDLLSRACIAVLPGSAFGAPVELLSARLAYVDFNGRNALAASKEIGLNESLDEAFLVEHCPKLVEGCKKIAEYCASVICE